MKIPKNFTELGILGSPFFLENASRTSRLKLFVTLPLLLLWQEKKSVIL
jgi:hypothetical protein